VNEPECATQCGLQQTVEGINAHALFYVAPHHAELRSVHVPFVAELCASGDVLVETLWSGLSRGTERLIFAGKLPQSEYSRMRAPFQEGDFPFPVKYGYCATGRVVSGPPGVEGRDIFSLHPHQDRFAIPAAAAVALPEGLPPRRAILAANMETALNAVWDSGASACDRVLVVGAGTVGLLIASILGRFAGIDLTVTDINPARRDVARSLGGRFVAPAETDGLEADVVFHASATAAGLRTALNACGFEARLVEVSWFGEDEPGVPLGGAFHSKRLRIVSSQVGSVSPERRSRWTHRRRMDAALELLRDDRLDALITHEVAFRDLPGALPGLLRPDADVLTAAIRYR
jgi:2-desacetyl-2-hydroxyethyl bacteriochlorophyllide A dehydrogenase